MDLGVRVELKDMPVTPISDGTVSTVSVDVIVWSQCGPAGPIDRRHKTTKDTRPWERRASAPLPH